MTGYSKDAMCKSIVAKNIQNIMGQQHEEQVARESTIF